MTQCYGDSGSWARSSNDKGGEGPEGVFWSQWRARLAGPFQTHTDAKDVTLAKQTRNAELQCRTGGFPGPD